MGLRINLRRCARAYVDSFQQATNSTIRLSNNSASQELLLVWDVTPGAEIANAMFLAYSQTGPLSTTVTTTPLVPGEPVPPGVLSKQGLATTITPAWFIQAGGQPWSGMQRTLPFAVLLPGWSLDVQNDGGGNIAIGCGFMWESLLPAYFDLIYGSYERLTTGSGALP